MTGKPKNLEGGFNGVIVSFHFNRGEKNIHVKDNQPTLTPPILSSESNPDTYPDTYIHAHKLEPSVTLHSSLRGGGCQLNGIFLGDTRLAFSQGFYEPKSPNSAEKGTFAMKGGVCE